MSRVPLLRRQGARRIVGGMEILEPRTMCAISDLDTTFNGTGALRFAFQGSSDTESATAVAVQPDGKIVVAGTYAFNGTAATDFAVARFNNDGSLDTTFGNNGRATIDFSFVANDERVTCMTLQDDGKIVIGGHATFTAAQDFVVARLNSDGTPDVTFDVDGRRRFDFAGGGSSTDQAFGIATMTVNGQRRIVLVGSTEQTTAGELINFGVVIFNDDGSVQVSFDRSAGGNDIARAVAIDSQNRIVVGGSTDIGANPDNFAIMRFSPGGADDAGFNVSSPQIIDFGFDDEIRAIQVVAGDKIVAAGFDDGGSSNFALVRLTANGTLDTTFNDLPAPSLSNGDGKLSFNVGGADFATSLAVQADGRLVVGGYTSGGGGVINNLAVARVTADGTLDTSFNSDGRRIYELGSFEEAHALALDSIGRIVLAGRAQVLGINFDMQLVRIKAFENLGNELKLTGSELTFTDLQGVNNNLTVTRTASALVFTDPAAAIINPFGAPSTTVSVPLNRISRVNIRTQEGNDRLRFSFGAVGFNFTLGIGVELGNGTDTLLAVGNRSFAVSNTKLISGSTSIALAEVDRVILQGGSGNNRLDARTFTGTAVLDGGLGNDTLLAGSGRSILIGGKGTDTITGGANQDIVIGGTVTLNILQPGFLALVDKWAGPGTYATRIAQVRNGTGLPAGLKLNASTVPNDTAADTLTGGGNLDWFWAYTLDFVGDKTASEIQN